MQSTGDFVSPRESRCAPYWTRRQSRVAGEVPFVGCQPGRRRGLVFGMVTDQVNEGDAHRKISHASATAMTAQPTARKAITAARWRATRIMRRLRTRAPVTASITTAQTKSKSTTAITGGVIGRSGAAGFAQKRIHPRLKSDRFVVGSAAGSLGPFALSSRSTLPQATLL